MKSLIRGWKDLSFNQKATLLLVAAGVLATWLGYFESRNERIKAEEAVKKVKHLAIQTVQAMVANGGAIMNESWNEKAAYKAQEDLLKDSDVSPEDIKRILSGLPIGKP